MNIERSLMSYFVHCYKMSYYGFWLFAAIDHCITLLTDFASEAVILMVEKDYTLDHKEEFGLVAVY